MNDLISRQDAIDAMAELQGRASSKGELTGISKAWKKIKQMPSAEPKGLSCDGCKFCGQLDTEFPCNSCVRREKDYYAGFNQQTGCD